MQRLRRFEADSLEDALEQVRREMGADARIASAEKVRRGGVGGFFAKETFEITVELDEELDLPELPESPELSEPAAPRSIMDLVDEVSAAESASPPPPVPAPTPAPRVSTETPSFAAVLHRLADASAPSSPISTAPPPVEIPVDNHRLVRLGLPERYLPARDERRALLEALAGLPQAPALPQWTGSVVAVIGPRDEALPLARELAADLGHDPKEVALAAPAYKGRQIPAYLQIPTAAVAQEQRRSWRRRTTPTVVVVEAPVGGRQSPWASEVLDALEPALAWGVVDASRKLVDIAAWNRAVGGVDVLAVKRVEETTAPADILSLGIPVGRLDDQPATAERWAELLWERLAA